MELARMILVNAPIRFVFRRADHVKRAIPDTHLDPRATRGQLVEQWSRESVKSLHLHGWHARDSAERCRDTGSIKRLRKIHPFAAYKKSFGLGLDFVFDGSEPQKTVTTHAAHRRSLNVMSVR